MLTVYIYGVFDVNWCECGIFVVVGNGICLVVCVVVSRLYGTVLCVYSIASTWPNWIGHPPTKREIAGSSPVVDYTFAPLFHHSHFPSTLSTSFTRLSLYHDFSTPSSSDKQYRQPVFFSTKNVPTRLSNHPLLCFLFQNTPSILPRQRKYTMYRKTSFDQAHTNVIRYPFHFLFSNV